MPYTPVEALAGQLQREQINRALGELDATGLVGYARVGGTNYTLTSTTAAQKIFNTTANGALTLQTGRYHFRLQLYIVGMSATSGNAQFDLVGAGTATVAGVLYHVSGVDSSTPLAVGTRTGSASGTSASAANMVSADVGTGLFADIAGTFNVTAAGTIIPSVALTTATAAQVAIGTWVAFWRLADTGSNFTGDWS